MGYYLRILSPKSGRIEASVLRRALADSGLKASLSGDTELAEWEELVVAHPDGTEICAVERNEVGAEGLGYEEIGEFLDELEDGEPKSAADWLASYLPSVRSIYAIQILHGTYEDGGWDIVGCVKEAIWNAAGGILQADHEGFSNEDGYHILWQFADDVDGEWAMAVLADGRWRKFRMDLGNREYRAAFLRGEVPAGIQVIE
jgi:hypothetical protein